MTLGTDSTSNTTTLSGRELALNRRKAMALHGKTAVAKSSKTKPAANKYNPSVSAQSGSRPATSPRPSPSTTSTPIPAVAINNGREASRARRAALSTAGKAALSKSNVTRPAGRVRPPAPALQASAATAATPKSCGCGCNGTKASCDTGSSDSLLNAAAPRTEYVVATQPARGRAVAQARRAVLAQNGKSGLKRVAQAIKVAARGQDLQTAMTDGVSGREVARQHRLEQSMTGAPKTASKDKRPTGRIRARADVPAAPPKVEVGHTLSGHGVTGTMLERSLKVTGNEPGSCRAITGTEYIGAEQFDSLCSARPAAPPSKIGVSHTIRDHKVTGTEISRTGKVTGDEPGTCRGITGTEYLAAERFEQCATRPAPTAPKVVQFDSAKGKSITGTSVNRSDKVTGNESATDRAITGTEYSSLAKGARAPEKVVVSHTSQGKTVTGTALGNTSKLTGVESGACVGVTGTEYLSTEQFTSLCNTAAPETPRKVSVMSSRAQQEISGTGVGRAANVTGDEPGSCRTISGSQYYTSDNFSALCSTPSPQKVASMQTLAGRTLTGTAVGRSANVTGDERGGCTSVTGTEYLGADQQKAVCDVVAPVAPVAKVAVDQTWRGQSVTGTYVGRSQRVTGDEPGGCAPISGTPYIGRGQYNGFCESPALSDQEARIRTGASIPALSVTGDRPGAGGSKMTGDERGACEVISGTPYIGVDNTVSQCATSGRFVARPSTWVEPTRAPAPTDFSIKTPARAAQIKHSNDVTGTGYNSERITGPVNKANGLITGTPEFRHRDLPQPVPAVQQSAGAQEEAVTAARRVTGEGSQAGRPVTGDAWSGLSRVSGTEGASTQSRNLSERGNPRGMGMNASRFKEEVQPPAVPDSRITGSAGNTGRGALVTLSGGARG